MGDACDPNPVTAGDKILLFTPFTDEVGYAVNGGTAEADDVQVAGAQATLTTMASYVPTRVEAGVKYKSPTTTDVISLLAGGGDADRCVLDDGDALCLGMGCIGAGHNGFNPTSLVTWADLATTDTLRMDVDSGSFSCIARANGTISTRVSVSQGVVTGTVGVAAHTSPGDAAIVRYLIIYGR